MHTLLVYFPFDDMTCYVKILSLLKVCQNAYLMHHILTDTAVDDSLCTNQNIILSICLSAKVTYI